MIRKTFHLLLPVLLSISCATTGQVMKPSSHMDDPVRPVQEQNATIDNFNIHYLVSGSGDPVVLIHGWLCWGGNFDSIIPTLSENHTVYAPDLLGHGLSSKSPDDMDYMTDRQADIIVKFIKTVIGKPVYLIGHSMGGEISAKVTLLAPEMIRKLVLVDAVGLEENPKIIPLPARMIRSMNSYELAACLSNETIVRTICRQYMYYKTNPVEEHTLKGIMTYTFGTKESRKSFAGISRKGLFYDFIDQDVTAIKTPTLLVWGMEDMAVPLCLGFRYHSLIKDSQMIVIPHAGHMVFEEKPGIFLREVCAFLSEN